MGQPKISIVWQPQLGPQTDLITCPVGEVFFGGARGGGKTDGMLGEFAKHASMYGEHAIGLMVRRQRTELVETIERSRALYGPIGWKFHEQDKSWRAPNGARLRFAYLERDADADAYQGHSYTRVYIEEAGTFPSYKPIAKLMATLRSGAGVPVGLRLTGNPGGPGHQWVKARYIDPSPAGYEIIRDVSTGLERVYIPSRVRDNRYLGDDYVQRLKASGSEQLVRAWLEGDWSVIDGAFFDCWSNAKHVLKPISLPDDWLRFRSCDWGSASPFSVGWWAVVGDTTRMEGREIPRGSLIRYREWYGASAPNVGLKLTAAEVARGILAREAGEKVTYGVLDPAAFAEDGGPSIAQMMAREGCHFRPADNKRVSQKGALSGWDQMRARMVGVDGVPMLYVFETCKDFIRTVPALQHDRDRPEDLDTAGEDHCFTGDTLVRTSKGLYYLADLVGTEGQVLSHDGVWHEFRSARRVKRDQPIVRLAFSDGSTVRCTPDHKFLTATGWMEARHLSGRAILSLSALQRRNSTDNAITVAAATISARVSGFIAEYGSAPTARFRMVGTYTTPTMTGTTTPLPISNACRWLRTSGIVTAQRLRSAANSIWTGQRLGLLFGTGVMPGASGIGSNIASTVLPRSTFGSNWFANSVALALRPHKASSVPTNASRHGDGHPALMTKRASVKSAQVGSRSISIPSLGHARAIVGRLPAHASELVCLKVEEAGRADVYCLTVPSTGNFALANGALVANCADEARYGCMSRPWVPSKAPEPPKDRLVYEAGPNGVATAQIDLMAYLEKKRKAREQRF